MNWNFKKSIKEIYYKEKSSINVGNYGSKELDFCLIYPNTYNIAITNLGYQSIYEKLNSSKEVICHRSFLPSEQDKLELAKNNDSIISIEEHKPIGIYDIIGFSISFELDYFNVLEILKMGKLPLRSSDRNEDYPLIIAGGPCITFNPEPLSHYIDLFVIGESEEVINELVKNYIKYKDLKKDNLLKELAKTDGIYVPSLYSVVYNNDNTIKEMKPINNVPKKINKRWVKDLNSFDTKSVIISPLSEFKNMFLIEISRGCYRNCKFCAAAFCYKKPRYRNINNILSTISNSATNIDKIGLVGAAISDHPEIDNLVCEIRNMGLKFSVSSLRADSTKEKLIKGLAESGQNTITIAPETGSEGLRNEINKKITNKHIYDFAQLAIKHEIKNIKLYFIIGLPKEKQEDIEEIVNLIKRISRIKGINNISISINPFIPKPFTPYQWYPFDLTNRIKQKYNLLKKSFKRNSRIKLSFESINWSMVQVLLSRGDRRIGLLLEEVYQQRGKYQSIKKAAKINGIDLEFYLNRKKDLSETLPWDFINLGFDKEYLLDQL